MSDLNQGQGRCQSAARLLIRPVRAAIELGASEDVLNAALKAVHHANRQGNRDDFIAIGLPMLRMGRELMQAGHDMELVGSELVLARFLALEGVERLLRRGMIETPAIGPINVDLGMIGSAFVRDRFSEKHTAGWLRRSQARAERRGKPLGKAVTEKRHDPKMLTITCGHAILHIKEVLGSYVDEPLMVSTYGFSTVSAPAILPIYSNTARGAEDAA